MSVLLKMACECSGLSLQQTTRSQWSAAELVVDQHPRQLAHFARDLPVGADTGSQRLNGVAAEHARSARSLRCRAGLLDSHRPGFRLQMIPPLRPDRFAAECID